MRVSMGLTDRRKTAKNIVDSRNIQKLKPLAVNTVIRVNRKGNSSLDLLILRKVLHSVTECVFYFPGTVTPYARYAKRL